MTRQLTKNDLRKLLDLWESQTIDQMAETLEIPKNSVIQLASLFRKEGLPIPKKRERGLLRKLIKEVIEEQ